jgi:NADP-dependent 3-hydroxy acid dehydrogenase YdfG
MSIATVTSPIRPEPGLLGQPVVVIGGSAGIGLETARRAHAEGAKLNLAARNPDRLEHASRELGTLSNAAIEAAGMRMEGAAAEQQARFAAVCRSAGGVADGPVCLSGGMAIDPY